MEEAFSRFPHLLEQIFENLNNWSLAKCRKVSASWKHMIDSQRGVCIRRIRLHINCSRASLENNLRKKNIEDLVALADQVHKVYMYNPKGKYGITLLHSAAENGHSEVCQLILENVQDKNPKGEYGKTPLHYAAENGHLEVCQLILENVQDKNPTGKFGATPLHYAAKNGLSKVCQLILENIQDKNPKGQWGKTPLHYATENGHSEVCQLILANMQGNGHPAVVENH